MFRQCTFLGCDNVTRCWEIVSAGTLVSGIQRYRLAWQDKRGYSPSCSLHQLSGLTESGRGFTSSYLITSSNALSFVVLDTATGVYVFPRRSARVQEMWALWGLHVQGPPEPLISSVFELSSLPRHGLASWRSCGWEFRLFLPAADHHKWCNFLTWTWASWLATARKYCSIWFSFLSGMFGYLLFPQCVLLMEPYRCRTRQVQYY